MLVCRNVSQSKEEKKIRVKKIIARLRKAYPGVKCALDFTTPFELLAATILSAQCTDKRVNRVTPVLFDRCRTLQDYADIPINELEKIIQSTGFYKNKAKRIQGAAREILKNYGGEVPKKMEELVKLPGVGRKTANVLLGNAFQVPGIPVDTHMIRINHLLKLTKHKDPVKIEFDLMELVPEKDWTDYSHLIIHHGRVRCIARRPDCLGCEINSFCPSAFMAQKGSDPKRSIRV